MDETNYTYVIVGGGLAGASAVSGIREVDPNGPILLIGKEQHLPYDRPPLSKKLWSGKKKVEDIFINNREFYDRNGVTLALGVSAKEIDPDQRKIVCWDDKEYSFEKLLLSTGATPRTLPVPGGKSEGIIYFRTLDDFLGLRNLAAEGKSATVIGGGFIGSEISAALCSNKVDVTMVFPGAHLCDRVFPQDLGRALQKRYEDHGVKIMAKEKVVSFEKTNGSFVTNTESGMKIKSDLVVAGIGVTPDAGLAQGAGLRTGDGIVVNDCLQTSQPHIYAAGDNAQFPYQALGKSMRVEHWDNALNQGKCAGRNMAGMAESYSYMPYFFSDLFEFGYEAVGEVSASLETHADWQKENDTGVVYYLKQGRIAGVMLCNIWDKVGQARELIRKAGHVGPADLNGLIR